MGIFDPGYKKGEEAPTAIRNHFLYSIYRHERFIGNYVTRKMHTKLHPESGLYLNSRVSLLMDGITVCVAVLLTVLLLNGDGEEYFELEAAYKRAPEAIALL